MITPSARLKAQLKLLADNQRIAASVVSLGSGWSLTLDRSPGVGWVLACPKQPNRYFPTKEAAIERHKALTHA